MRNQDRYDLSDWLIHFTRAVDLEEGPESFPIDWDLGEMVEDTKLSPFFLLRRIVRKRQILSTWSMRGGKRTIYGPDPAVCFTEMPIGAFVQASAERAERGENISSYAIMIPRVDAFAAGARQVIYGLSQTAVAQTHADGSRRLPTSALALIEQFRYSAYDPTRAGKLDWAHEREWRWPNRSSTGFNDVEAPRGREAEWEEWQSERERHGRHEHDGLCLDRDPVSHVGLIVKSQQQADLLVHDVLRLVDQGVVPESLFGFVLVLQRLPAASVLADQTVAAESIRKSTVNLSDFYALGNANSLVDKFDHIVTSELANVTAKHTFEAGGCWLWLRDNKHPLVRTLFRQGRAKPNQRGRYLVELPLPRSLPLRDRQEATGRVAERVRQAFSTAADYYSVLGSHDPDELPSYAGNAHEDDPVLYNYAHTPEDF
ncbi:MAG TPA: DUF4427 domain-containing protein [Polyangiaceae bacterium LLY-WYZ-15_(1-7)]|nr:DUF4427 domain-containing protein [Polyangiaceae bacterium LLY-WYZ-15_(1-7)]HJL12214.1 DUF4427 domain-containing protein [Polyangiaceae bacterium LLY-WYZ-15_(1-7)]HJL23503.1 DUF4427 domain-containing protein [Polyangiaceae bacterium LLY-WYZ-15_(1-7)]HJL29533.1 DUF4427 domain-containing protein [Polyangiaceae bacterium LLY-WYZ-15_(1-7)]